MITFSISYHDVLGIMLLAAALIVVLVYVYFGTRWAGRIHCKYVVDVMIPVAQRVQRDDYSELHLFEPMADKVRAHEGKLNPFFWFRHWNDSYSPFHLASSAEIREIAALRKSQNGGER